MRTTTLGKDLKVSAVGFGSMGLTIGYGQPLDHDEAIKLIRQAYDLGYRLFDTAEVYQAQDAKSQTIFNEELVGEALHDVRDSVVISTKFGIKPGKEGASLSYVPDSSPRSIRESVEGSLKRLNADHIDLYFQHRIDPKVSPEEVADTMNQLIKEGKITQWGISEANADYLKRANAVSPVTAVQNRYSMMYRNYEDLFPLLKKLNVGLVAFSPLANGFLSGQLQSNNDPQNVRSKMPQFSEQAKRKNQELLDLLQKVADQHHATPAQISLAWMINKDLPIVPIPGSRHLNRVEDNFTASQIKMDASEVAQLDQALDAVPMSDVFGGNKAE